jgi:tripartite-type tricarboxylate transporter receptor subunit TctC
MRRGVLLAAVLATAALSSATVFAQKYPTRPVRIVVGFGAGGGTDLAARAIAQKLTEAFGSTFIVDNRPGASGNLAADIVAKAAPDGYTIFMANSTIAVPALFTKLPFAVSNIALGPSLLVVHASVPANDVKSFIALARSKPKQLTYGSGGVGNYTHLAMELFISLTGTDMVHVPYKGGLPSVQGLLTGEVQSLFTSIATVLPQLGAGKMKALGVSTSKRNPAVPNVPTISEAGVPGYYAASWYGLMLPAGTSPQIVAALSKEITRIMRLPDIRDPLIKQGFEPIGDTPGEFSKFIREEIARWEGVVKRAGIKGE